MNFNEKYWCFQAFGRFSFWSTFSVFFQASVIWKWAQSRKAAQGSPRQPSHVLLQRRAEKMAREMRVRWLQKEGMGSVLCWQGTCRGCGSSPQTPLNVELPQNRVRCGMFAEPRANTWVASPWMPWCQDCPKLAPPGVCKGQLHPHKLQSQLASAAPHRCLWSLQNFGGCWLVCGPQCWKKSSSVTHALVFSEQVPSHPSLCSSLLSTGHFHESAQSSFAPAPRSQRCLQPLWAGGSEFTRAMQALARQTVGV